MDEISSYFDMQLYKLIYKKWGLQENCGKLCGFRNFFFKENNISTGILVFVES